MLIQHIGTLGFYIGNPQCRHILIGCCHDAGYVPVLKQYSAHASSTERITLLSAGRDRPDIESLGFRITSIFEPLFPRSVSPPFISGTPSPTAVQQSVDAILAAATRENAILAVSSATRENPVNNSGRLGPILRDRTGKRVDKRLSVDEALISAMRRYNLCGWYYLRAECGMSWCSRNHNYPRPLSLAEFDALWCITKQGICNRFQEGQDCNDDKCIFSHGQDVQDFGGVTWLA